MVAPLAHDVLQKMVNDHALRWLWITLSGRTPDRCNLPRVIVHRAEPLSISTDPADDWPASRSARSEASKLCRRTTLVAGPAAAFEDTQ
jgi:hypothetical protein